MTEDEARALAIWIIDNVPDILGMTPDPWPYGSDDIVGDSDREIAYRSEHREVSIQDFSKAIQVAVSRGAFPGGTQDERTR